jgi:hypothetical protein
MARGGGGISQLSALFRALQGGPQIAPDKLRMSAPSMLSLIRLINEGSLRLIRSVICNGTRVLTTAL